MNKRRRAALMELIAHGGHGKGQGFIKDGVAKLLADAGFISVHAMPEDCAHQDGHTAVSITHAGIDECYRLLHRRQRVASRMMRRVVAQAEAMLATPPVVEDGDGGDIDSRLYRAALVHAEAGRAIADVRGRLGQCRKELARVTALLRWTEDVSRYLRGEWSPFEPDSEAHEEYLRGRIEAC